MILANKGENRGDVSEIFKSALEENLRVECTTCLCDQLQPSSLLAQLAGSFLKET